ncbi:hypothetical protein ECMP0210175_3033 [Escherichia coli MP021017.5]|nr:hypothetical protein ECMP0210179_3105 [Escherichia coli MP021017.9]EMU79809.1 hypothetical protein ECMP0210176_3134 [Escherichia coli MP021017.6]EMU81871.1 hypothetical protein ECMP0210175_3033 [Escherichia coli MP021017.5]EMU91944.1 hypothetical protein ECMP0210174_3032 [Escherichia coli MP021017.4]EMU93465.1 hypothetical protein ECMP0210173_3164 [Escherichia coli MP021017.3]EMU96698.1 hypothetical protein ECMP0210172_3099 [Escherichia coli MP021017.2]EMV05392.1 hypothetical protein ECMP0
MSSHVIVTSVDDIFFPALQKLISLNNSELKTGMICECIGALTVIAGESDEPFHHC